VLVLFHACRSCNLADDFHPKNINFKRQQIHADFIKKKMNVVVTGASKGLGKAIAEKFAAHGHTLLLTSRNPDALESSANALRSVYGSDKVFAKPFDLSSKVEANACGDWINSTGMPVDVLVNNAGLFVMGTVSEEADGVMEDMMNVNFYSAYHLTRKLLPAMKARRSGHIFNICSIASTAAYKYGGSYSVSKFALLGFSKNLRLDCMPHGIKVTAILPGATLSDSWQGFDNSEKRIMEASDVAATVFAATQLSVQAVVEEIVMRPQLGDL
jgi:short-subunit dehydrogenase